MWILLRNYFMIEVVYMYGQAAEYSKCTDQILDTQCVPHGLYLHGYMVQKQAMIVQLLDW